jgi:hypothetical protein
MWLFGTAAFLYHATMVLDVPPNADLVPHGVVRTGVGEGYGGMVADLAREGFPERGLRNRKGYR